MAQLKIEKLNIGPGDLESGSSSQFTSGSAAPINANGSDGDVYVQTAGPNSNVFLRKNGVWVSLLAGLTFTVSVPDNTSNYQWFSLPLSVARFFKFDYGAYRGGNFQKGALSAVTDGASLSAISNFGIVSVGTGTPGVSFDVSISSGNVNFLATTASTGSSLTLEYSLSYLT